VKGNGGPDAQFALARVLEKQGKLNEAENAYRQVLAEKPNEIVSKQAQLGLIRVLLDKANKAPPAPTEALRPTTTTSGNVSQAERNRMETVLVLMSVLVADPETVPAEIAEAIKRADELIAQKEYLGHILKAAALAKLKRFNDALKEYSIGIKELKVLPKEYDGVLDQILALHPALQKPDQTLVADNSLALKHYAEGLDYFRACRFDKAEKEFVQTVRFYNKDARYWYYLGLSRWIQGKETDAIDALKTGAVLETQGKPATRAVSDSLERVQGGIRGAIERFRP
jgi:tetratricopeptide (TPR) repeat protein